MALKPSEAQLTSLLQLYQSGRFAEAEAAATSLTEQFPEHPFAWKVLGSVLQKQSRVDESLVAKQRVLDLRPLDAESHNNLGNALHEACRFAEAEDRFRRAIALKADYAEAYSNLGNTLRTLGRFGEAITVCISATELKPGYAIAHCHLGNALKDLERFAEAATSYEQAIKLDPNYAIAHNNLGVALQELGRLGEAEASYAKAISLDPALGEAYNNLATAQTELGSLGAAENSYLRAIKLAPNSAEVLRNFANSATQFDPESEAVAQMREVYRNPHITGHDRCQICFALAKVSQDLEDYASAFQYFAEGNALRKKQLGYDIKTDVELFANLKASYRKLVTHIPPQKAKNSTIIPVFIVGMPRSGTTLVEQIVSSHPQVTGAGELGFVSELGSAMLSASGALNEHSLRLFREQYLRALDELAEGKVLVTDKMPQNFRYLGLISLAIPEARVIHVRRNPAAVCWANYAQYFSKSSLGYLYSMDDILAYYQLYRELMVFWERSLSIDIYDIDYELLTESQEHETRRLIDYLDLDWDEACLSPENNDRRVATASSRQVRKKIYQGSSERWKRYRPYLGGALDSLDIVPQ